MIFIQVGSVQMISGSWGCPCPGARSMCDSDKTSGAECNSIGQMEDA
ncbi:hypothetical protein ABIB75_007454 [Bradyrhizobium sp. GM2.2]